MYVEVPRPLTREKIAEAFGMPALRYYEERIRQRANEGKVYLNPLKTIYIWAAQDKASGQGYFSTLFVRGMNRRKCKNHGRS